MRLGRYIKNYFLNTEIKNWNYNDFKDYLNLLGYNDEDYIYRTYIRRLREMIDTEPDNNRRRITMKILKRSGSEVSKVIKLFSDISNLILIMIKLFTIYTPLLYDGVHTSYCKLRYIKNMPYCYKTISSC